jgi:hypothetical protein
MEISLDQGILARGDIYRGISCRIRVRGSLIVEDSHVDAAIETGNPITRGMG